MTDEKVNNQEPVPDEGQTGEKAGEVTEDYSGLSDEKLEELVKGKPASVPEPVNEPETKTDEGANEPEPAPEPTVKLPENLKGKSAEELAKDYVNLRKKLDEQGVEIGELRKYKKENAALDEELKQYGVNTTAQHLVEKEVLKMNEEEKNKFYEVFSENPAEALIPLINKAIKPITLKQARTDNEAEIARLEDKAKDSLVPYDRKKINKIIAGFTRENGRNDLFDKHGKGAFEAAYDIYYKQNVGKALEAREKDIREKALREAEEAANKRTNTFTEPQGISSASTGGKPANYEDMTDAQLDQLVGKPKDKD